MELTLQQSPRTHQNLRVFIVCPGVGHIHRGFESFTEECWTALSARDDIDPFLVKGVGARSARNLTARCCKRESALAKVLGLLTRRDGYFIEQVTFALGLIPLLLIHKPHIIFFSDGTIGNVLYRLRRLLPAKPALLFSNGGPLFPPYCKCDFIQEIVPHMHSLAATNQLVPHTLVPYGFNIPRTFAAVSHKEKRELRATLGLPQEGLILLSVAALSIRHKRLDYLITELARCPEPRPFLLLLGSPTDETPRLKDLARELLGAGSYRFLTVSHAEMSNYYQATDALCHTALAEGFGRCIVEALAHGLPVLLHDSPGNRFVAADEGMYADLSAQGGLRGLILNLLQSKAELESRQSARHRYVHGKFSWDILALSYIAMFNDAISHYRRKS